MPDNTVPFNKPVPIGPELSYIQDAIKRMQLAGDGYYSKKCEASIQDFVGSTSVHLTHSCTAALEMAAILCDLGPGDEVIMPSYTFVSTANAVVLRGAIPVFVDIKPETLNLDPVQVEAAISDRTRAIFPVHYAGVICEMDKIVKLAKTHDLMVVEDAAQAFGSFRDDKPAGSFGDMACFSFHETKNIISGEGGCLTTNSDALEYRAEIIREKGTNRKAFFKGLVDKYSWVDLGSSFLPGELVAAFLFAQLEEWERINRNRVKAWGYYFESFKGLEEKGYVRRPIIPDNVIHNGHLFYLILENETTRDEFMKHMQEQKISCPFHYVPLHSSEYGSKNTKSIGDLAITNELSSRLVRLPLFNGVNTSVDQVLDAAYDFFKK